MSDGEQRIADLERRLADLSAELAIQQHLVSLLLDLNGAPSIPRVQRPVRHLQVVVGGVR